ncbi:MAG: ribonuclease E/G [Lachnospiraceae bacterium]|nr:ribonuclease E/G [Lachnospiraceae bacterium]
MIQKQAVTVAPEYTKLSDDKLLLIRKHYKKTSGTGLKDPVLMARVCDNRLVYAGIDRNLLLDAEEGKQIDRMGDIYVGQILNITGERSVFVRIREGKTGTDEEKAYTMGFLEIPSGCKPVLCDRPFIETRNLAVGDSLLVQVKQLPQKNKLMTLTPVLQFPGRYFVLSAGTPGLSFSSKIGKGDKEKLREMLGSKTQEILEKEPCKIMVRTKAADASEEILLGELAYLHTLFHKVMTQGIHRALFERVAEGYDPLMDYLYRKSDNLPEEVLTDDPLIYEKCKALLDRYGLSGKMKVRLYEESGISLSALYGLSDKMSKCLNRVIWLKGGGSIVIDQTEAMTVIDVNSSKDIKKEKKNAQGTKILEINLEAAKEAMEQIRLRNLSGMILIDFINMDKGMVPVFLEQMKKLLEADRGRTHFMDYTRLGICEYTREKQDKPLAEEFVDICLD